MTSYDDDDFDDPQEALAHYREVLKARQAYKRALEMQQAKYGLATPPHVQTDLENVRSEIRQLRQWIKQLEGGSPSPSTSTPSSLPIYSHPLPMEFPANDWQDAPEAAMRAVLQTIHHFQQQSASAYVGDTQIAEALQMDLQDVRDYMDLLEAAGDTKSANSHDGHEARLTAQGRLRLRKT
jgi:hypothetical protein